jgi:hypothetical protein
MTKPAPALNVVAFALSAVTLVVIGAELGIFIFKGSIASELLSGAGSFFLAAIGALVGAYAAFRLAAVQARTQRLESELLACNATMELSNAITNTAMGLKRQHVANLAKEFSEQLSDYLEAHVEKRVIKVKIDFSSVPNVRVPSNELQDMLLTRVTGCARAVTFAVHLAQSLDRMRDAINGRDRVIESAKGTTDLDKIAIYFGMKRGVTTDSTYPDLLSSMSESLDDALYFSLRLTQILELHGQYLQHCLGHRILASIVIEELEAWYFGDWNAAVTAYPRLPATVPQRSGLRDPDAIAGGTWEQFERICQRAGYFSTGLRKIEAARAISEHFDVAQNSSASFGHFRAALLDLAA